MRGYCFSCRLNIKDRLIETEKVFYNKDYNVLYSINYIDSICPRCECPTFPPKVKKENERRQAVALKNAVKQLNS